MQARERRVAVRRDFGELTTEWTIWLLALSAVAREILGQSELVSLGFYTFHVIDPPVFMSLIAVIANLAVGRLTWRIYTLPILVIAGLILLNFMRGVVSDPGHALLWSRSYCGIATLLFLSISARPSRRILAVIQRSLVLTSVALLLLFSLRLGTRPNLFMLSITDVSEINDGGRCLSVFGTFLMLLTALFTISQQLRRGRLTISLRSFLAVVLPVAIPLTGQGTATIATAISILCIILLERGPGRGFRIGMGLFVVASALLLSQAANMETFSSSQSMGRRLNNLEIRQKVWDALSADWPRRSYVTQIIGLPGGESPRLIVYAQKAYREWTANMHSMYYGALPLMGYMGLVCYLFLLMALTILSLAGILRRGAVIPSYVFATCVAVWILSYSYEIRSDSLFALILVIFVLRERAGSIVRAPRLRPL